MPVKRNNAKSNKAKSDKASGRKSQPVKIEDVEINWEAPQRIVSSEHLVSPRSPELSEFEFGMILAVNSFNRWVVRCMTAAGIKELSTLETLLLHHVHHRARKKKLADICFMYNIEDTHVVLYSLKKLVNMRLVEGEKNGKEVLFSTTPLGAQVIERYRQVRERCLMERFSTEGDKNSKLKEMAEFLRYLSALYDQAAREATSL
jgi:predicted MarR family transcription regulator